MHNGSRDIFNVGLVLSYWESARCLRWHTYSQHALEMADNVIHSHGMYGNRPLTYLVLLQLLKDAALDSEIQHV